MLMQISSSASNRVLRAGDTMTGGLTIAASSGSLLNISGLESATPLLGATAGAASNALINLSPSSDGIVRWGLRLGASTTFSLGLDYRDSATGNPVNLITFLRTGFVGIGNTNPAYKLSVTGTAGFLAQFTDGTRDIRFFSSTNFASLGSSRVGDDWKFFVDNNSNVGLFIKTSSGNIIIGTSSTTDTGYKLNIGGAGTVGGLKIVGAINESYSTQTASGSFGAADNFIDGDATSAAIVWTLPLAAAGNTGLTYGLGKLDSGVNSVTLATTSSQLINNATTYVLASQYKYVWVRSTGSAWRVIMNN